MSASDSSTGRMLERICQYVPEFGMRQTFDRLTCDECGTCYTANFSRCAAMDARTQGWEVVAGRDLCPPCQVERAIDCFRAPYPRRTRMSASAPPRAWPSRAPGGFS